MTTEPGSPTDNGPLSAEDTPWYAEGLQFTCQWPLCVRCCTGEEGYVWLNEREVKALAATTGLGRDAFLARHTTVVGRKLSLCEVERGDCTLLGEGGCTVYEARPAQCASYPFWPEVVSSKVRWESEAKDCPGINTGDQVWTREQIDARRAMHHRGEPADGASDQATGPRPIGGGRHEGEPRAYEDIRRQLQAGMARSTDASEPPARGASVDDAPRAGVSPVPRAPATRDHDGGLGGARLNAR